MKKEGKATIESTKTVIFTPTDIQEFIKKKTETLLLENTFNGFVVVEGILGELKDGKYPNIYYGISLRDTIGGIISVNIPKAIANKAYQGKKVVVSGFIRTRIWNGKLDFFIDVSKIEPKTEMDKDVLEKEKTLSEFLSSYKKHRKSFPDKDIYTISVIHGATSQVKADFENQINDINEISVKFHSVNIVNPESIIEVINKTEADIIVIIRGGGADGEFDVFNELRLLEAWINKDAYKISALGHTEHRTYIDIFSDASCDTPTDAGIFIRRNIEKIRSLKEYQVSMEKHKEEIKKLTDEWNKRFQELQKNKDEEFKQINEKVYKNQKELTEKFEIKEKLLMKQINTYRWGMFIETIILIAVIIYIVLKN